MSAKTAVLYRMLSDKHICPFGLKAKYLLKKNGFVVEDRLLQNREETDEFKKEHDVKTTPQVFIDGERVGGYEALREYLGLSIKDKNKVSYKPIIAIFSVTLLMALALHYAIYDAFFHSRSFFWFIAFTMCVLAIQKLRDLDAFSNQFITYDLLAMRYLPYGTIYPFAEAYAGIGMLSGINPWLVAPVALFIGTIGAVSVIKAVYIDQRELKCACVGGNSNVPLGFISLTENVMMVGVALWMLYKAM